jgi:hypothetical protein
MYKSVPVPNESKLATERRSGRVTIATRVARPPVDNRDEYGDEAPRGPQDPAVHYMAGIGFEATASTFLTPRTAC